jgi:oligopeptide transport system ATP-binding protein
METAPVRELFARPAHPYTVGLLGAVPDLRDDTHKRLTPIPGSPPNMLAPPPGCPFAPRCPHAMSQCMAALPPLFGGVHQSRCWLQHPEAPKVDAVHEVAA